MFSAARHWLNMVKRNFGPAATQTLITVIRAYCLPLLKSKIALRCDCAPSMVKHALASIFSLPKSLILPPALTVMLILFNPIFIPVFRISIAPLVSLFLLRLLCWLVVIFGITRLAPGLIAVSVSLVFVELVNRAHDAAALAGLLGH
jgi:hypothetical protein